MGSLSTFSLLSLWAPRGRTQAGALSPHAVAPATYVAYVRYNAKFDGHARVQYRIEDRAAASPSAMPSSSMRLAYSVQIAFKCDSRATYPKSQRTPAGMLGFGADEFAIFSRALY
jgi:hypothetical protein